MYPQKNTKQFVVLEIESQFCVSNFVILIVLSAHINMLTTACSLFNEIFFTICISEKYFFLVLCSSWYSCQTLYSILCCFANNQIFRYRKLFYWKFRQLLVFPRNFFYLWWQVFINRASKSSLQDYSELYQKVFFAASFGLLALCISRVW